MNATKHIPIAIAPFAFSPMIKKYAEIGTRNKYVSITESFTKGLRNIIG